MKTKKTEATTILSFTAGRRGPCRRYGASSGRSFCGKRKRTDAKGTDANQVLAVMGTTKVTLTLKVRRLVHLGLMACRPGGEHPAGSLIGCGNRGIDIAHCRTGRALEDMVEHARRQTLATQRDVHHHLPDKQGIGLSGWNISGNETEQSGWIDRIIDRLPCNRFRTVRRYGRNIQRRD